jgi:hypothetical protein
MGEKALRRSVPSDVGAPAEAKGGHRCDAEGEHKTRVLLCWGCQCVSLRYLLARTSALGLEVKGSSPGWRLGARRRRRNWMDVVTRCDPAVLYVQS